MPLSTSSAHPPPSSRSLHSDLEGQWLVNSKATLLFASIPVSKRDRREVHLLIKSFELQIISISPTPPLSLLLSVYCSPLFLHLSSPSLHLFPFIDHLSSPLPLSLHPPPLASRQPIRGPPALRCTVEIDCLHRKLLHLVFLALLQSPTCEEVAISIQLSLTSVLSSSQGSQGGQDGCM